MDYITVVLLRSIFRRLGEISGQLKKQKELLKHIMATQEEFDAKIEAANATLDTLVTDVDDIAAAITAEAEQIAAFIAANPGVDTSALDGVQSRLGAVADSLGAVAGSVEGIFTPPAA